MDRSTLDLSEHAERIRDLLRVITHALEHEYSCTPEQWTTFRGEMTEALQKAWGQHGLTDDHGWKQLEPAILVQAVRVVSEQQWNTDHNDVTAAFMVADELETMRRDDCSFNDGMKTSLAPGQIGDEAPRSDQGLTGTRALPTGTAEHTLLPIEFRECLGKLLNELPTALKVQLIEEAETRSRQRPLAQTCRMKQGSGRYPKGMQQEPSSTNKAIDEEHESTGQFSSCLQEDPTSRKRANVANSKEDILASTIAERTKDGWKRIATRTGGQASGQPLRRKNYPERRDTRAALSDLMWNELHQHIPKELGTVGKAVKYMLLFHPFTGMTSPRLLEMAEERRQGILEKRRINDTQNATEKLRGEKDRTMQPWHQPGLNASEDLQY